MFKRVLIANRGEIALRIIRCLREMGIESVIVYSTADKASLPVMLATHSICIGPAKASDSYLKMETIIEIATKMQCDAIHPGYGFLSENAKFARLCEENKIVFIGPTANMIEQMGDKQSARKMMQANGIPVVPGSKELVKDVDDAIRIADEIGYPVLIKASAGGGGKGMRRAYTKDEIVQSFETAKSEAKAGFGDDSMYMEKLILNPHHIEVQILADQYGNIISLGERDCSIQKRNQKLLEESPAWILNKELRNKIWETAVKAAKAAKYINAGTVEFVLDENKKFYFIEMNTRIQVEHPVTEMITGIDLIKEQIRIAAGMKLSIEQKDVKADGHAIECRINAKETGTINFLHFPAGNGVRVDSHLYTGYEVTPFYDSMLAKIIVHGNTRLDAIRKMRRALEELMIEGIDTNSGFMHLLTFHPDFIKGNYNTSFWDKNSDEIGKWYAEGIKNE